MPVRLCCCCATLIYLSSNERQDVHLPRLAVLHGGDDEAGAAQDDLTSGPAVDWQLELPFANVVRPRELDSLGALDALGLPCAQRDRERSSEKQRP